MQQRRFKWTPEKQRRFRFVFPDTYPTEAIFPIYNFSAENNYAISQLVGTGFFIHPLGVFLTARHVAAAINQNDRPFVVYRVGTTPEASSVLEGANVMYVISSPDSDIAVGRIHAIVDPNTGNIRVNRTMMLTAECPKIDDRIATIAFPFSRVKDDNTAEWNPMFSQGTVVHFFDKSRGGMLNHPCWQTTMRIPGGASGGPVVNDVGVVFAVNSTEFEYEGGQSDSYITPITNSLLLHVPDGELHNAAGDVREDIADIMVPLSELAGRSVVFMPPLGMSAHQADAARNFFRTARVEFFGLSVPPAPGPPPR